MVSLVEMAVGESGIIKELKGGFGLNQKLENMGLRIGTKVKKINKPWRKGPVVVQSGNSQLALGYGISQKIMLEVQKDQS